MGEAVGWVHALGLLVIQHFQEIQFRLKWVDVQYFDVMIVMRDAPSSDFVCEKYFLELLSKH